MQDSVAISVNWVRDKAVPRLYFAVKQSKVR